MNLSFLEIVAKEQGADQNSTANIGKNMFELRTVVGPASPDKRENRPYIEGFFCIEVSQ